MTKFLENKKDGRLFNVDHIVAVYKPIPGKVLEYKVVTVLGEAYEVDEEFYSQCRNMHKNPLLTMEYKPYTNTGPR